MRLKFSAATIALSGLIAGGAAFADESNFPAFGSAQWKAMFAVDPQEERLAQNPVPTPENAARYTVTFKGALLGFDVGRVYLDVAASPSGYDLDYRMEQKGLARWFSDAEARSQSRGRFDGATIAEHYYFNHAFEGDDDFQYVELYRPNDAARMHLWSNPSYKFNAPVDEAFAAGAVDPMSALVALTFTSVPEGTHPCNRTVKVFDGRRRFDLILTKDGSNDLRGDSSSYEGEAYRCKLEQKKLGGYRQKDMGDTQGDVTVFLADVPEAVRTKTFAYVPVMIKARRGALGGTLSTMYPTITGPDGTKYELWKDG